MTSHASATAQQPLVHAVNVTKAFHGNEVLKGIDLDVHPGEVVCLLGPSGSGKTTFLRCINQLESIDGGRIWVDGELIGYTERGGHLHHLTDKRWRRSGAASAWCSSGSTSSRT
jgi:polar amino acid transport system ATP-binding protein